MNDTELTHYNAALDEIYLLRVALAYEAEVLNAHLDYKTFPKSRRVFAERQIARMRAAASGRAQTEYDEVPDRSLEISKRRLGITTFTREQWENQR